ncbi:hypothetical protein QP794_01105 [Paenibacillus sp. UMB7766-LJ446]|uniref:hypothetical protein n=1 Tax=Paenibacillus sp. UMB7766-LJ446 TaxID=3046313 RepID=UPI0023D8DCC5|nr:hypothetical protein [Paenibacillus sp. UMB7766-LJ446]MDK8188678.1 hypothetical protein [Paenibacillus sp. UMB7766-LJ446]
MFTRKKISYEPGFDDETGELVEYIRIKLDSDTEVRVESRKARLEKIKHLKKFEYREKGRRKKHFAQTMPAFEDSIVGKYPSKMLECLLRTLPYMNYNGDDITNSDDLIKINGLIANDTALSNLWGVSRPTAIKYINQFVADHVWERKFPEGFNGNAYRFKKDVFLKGKKTDKNYFSKKIVLENLKAIIEQADREKTRILKHPNTREERLFAEKLTDFYPIAFLGGLMIKTHYKSFFLVNNTFDDEIVKDEETVIEVLKSSHKKRRFKFLKKYQMWNLYSKTKTKKLSSERKLELEACMLVLKRIKALGRWETGKSEYYIMNPSLVYASPNMKCDDDWYNFIYSLFNLV